MNERNVLVEVQNLKKWFPVKKGLPMGEKKYVKAVDDVSFQVFQGEQDVIQYREMRIQSIVLKHHSQIFSYFIELLL